MSIREELQYNPKIMHAQEVAQEVLTPKDSEDCAYKQTRPYNVVNFFKNFSQSLYCRRKALAENIFCVSEL